MSSSNACPCRRRAASKVIVSPSHHKRERPTNDFWQGPLIVQFSGVGFRRARIAPSSKELVNRAGTLQLYAAGTPGPRSNGAQTSPSASLPPQALCSHHILHDLAIPKLTQFLRFQRTPVSARPDSLCRGSRQQTRHKNVWQLASSCSFQRCDARAGHPIAYTPRRLPLASWRPLRPCRALHDRGNGSRIPMAQLAARSKARARWCKTLAEAKCLRMAIAFARAVPCGERDPWQRQPSSASSSSATSASAPASAGGACVGAERMGKLAAGGATSNRRRAIGDRLSEAAARKLVSCLASQKAAKVGLQTRSRSSFNLALSLSLTPWPTNPPTR